MEKSLDLGDASSGAMRALDWRVTTDRPGNGDHVVNVWVGDRCVASFDVDDDLPDHQRRSIMRHLANTLVDGLGPCCRDY